MAIFRCKMCGGTIEFEPGASIGVCDSCGTKQTLPRLDDDRRANLYDRANHFRRSNEFDKAAGMYEQILNEDSADAEAYWSLVLCRYGIEYVEDPRTRRHIPTVNRAQFTSVFDDDNYRSALKYADSFQREIYENEAKTINDIQKGILAISQKEEPFDVFICYKETDKNGRRTPDSVLANDLYHQLTQEGFKVFFARITLEDKLGAAYEPYIFAALNSAKVMVVLGTRPEYFNAVWVKNEWSRYLALVKTSGGKKVLIPAYRDMDPYDLPEEFSHLQAQDMSKLGFMQDLIRGIKKIARSHEPKPTVVKETVITGGGNTNVAPLLERAFLFLEDGEWDTANEYCERVLDTDPKNALAYLGKLLAELKEKTREDLKDRAEPFDNNRNYQKAIRFADADLKAELIACIEHINERNENARLEDIYTRASHAMSAAHTEAGFNEAVRLFASISGWRDADIQILTCQRRIAEIRAREEADRLERARIAEEERLEAARRAEEVRIAKEIAAKKRKKVIATATPIVIACIAFLIVLTKIIIPRNRDDPSVVMVETSDYKTEQPCPDRKCESESNTAELQHSFSKVEVGSYIFFGSYEQDNDLSNGKEEIEWLVLAKEDDRVFVISRYALDCQPYNTIYKQKITWEICSLRKWLNETFIQNAFNNDEKNSIQSTTVTAGKNPSFSISPGNDTTDKVFILSIIESDKYLNSDEARNCMPTNYAISQGAYTGEFYKTDSKAVCQWWLRSPGAYSDFASYVNIYGVAHYQGIPVTSASTAVRPAMWISLES